jgi:hypothetical protein
MDRRAYGWDAEEIHAAHPHLSLAHIHAALSYYYAPQLAGSISRFVEDLELLAKAGNPEDFFNTV